MENPQPIDLRELEAHLMSKAAETALPTRFKIDDAPENVAAHLNLFYRYQAALRSHAYIENSEINLYIHKVASWLCGMYAYPGLMLEGKPGCGKTTLANAICEFIDTFREFNHGTKFRRLHALEISDAAKEERKDFLKGCIDCRFLFIDDVGTEPSVMKIWGNATSPLAEIMYARYDRNAFTIITSNIESNKSLEDKYGDRIADRFNEMFATIHFRNPSFRDKLNKTPLKQ